MRALMYKNRKRIFTPILATIWLMAPQVACCSEPVAADLRSESVPTSSIPLPKIEALPEQKPTSAIYSAQEIVATTWQIAPRILDPGDQKTAQSKCVSADCISAPLGVELPPCDTTVAPARMEPVKVETAAVKPVPVAPVRVNVPNIEAAPAETATVVRADEGVRKPSLSTAPVPQEIVQVQWSIKPRSVDTQAEYRTSVGFQASHCSLVDWTSESFEQIIDDTKLAGISPDAEIELVTMDRSSGLSYVASVERHSSPAVDQLTLNELQNLTKTPGADSEVTYLSELSQLLQGESTWLFADEELLDLAPEEGSVSAGSYIDDLNTLVKKRSVPTSHSGYHNTVAPQQAPADSTSDKAAATPKKSSKPYTSIAPDPKCVDGGGSGVSALFQSMSSIRLNGLSTAPPSRSREDVALTAELPRPDNRACQYLESYSPTYYATPMRYGSHRPSRDTHAFWHRPLYFEDENLERCGQTDGCLTTATSVVHFATLIAFSPYTMLAEHPASCIRSLPDCPTCHSFE